MTRSATPRLHAYAALVAAGLLGALGLERPEVAVLAAPFAVILALGLSTAREPKVGVWLSLEHDRVLEGDQLRLELDLATTDPVGRLDVLLVLPPGLELSEGLNPVTVALGYDDERTLELTLGCERWGSYSFGDIRWRARDRLGLLTWEWRVDRRGPLRVYPRPETVRELVRPLRTQVSAGNEVAREKGDGLEFADLRAFVPGDRVRSINWRASARRDELVVNEFHPERNTDVLLFLDSFAEARVGGRSTLDEAVRATATLAARYLGRRDRVGLVTFGGILRWLTPGMGMTQRYRIVDALLETEVEVNFAWKDVSVIPARVLPPQALVIAVTPLLDARAVAALLDLRARGYDLAVVEVSPEPFVSPGADELQSLAHRLWVLRRTELRSRYERLGVAVASWPAGTALDVALEEVRTYRRHARLARA